MILRWKPTDTIEIMPFWAMYNDHDDEAGTFYVPAGDFVPKVDKAHHDESPEWADNRFTGRNMGVVASALLGKNTLARFGVFRSTFKTKDFYNFLLTGIDEEGVGERILFSDPPRHNRSLSGEARITQSIPDGARLHNIHLSVRNRDSHRAFGGSDVISFGLGPVGERVTAPKPADDDFGIPTKLHTRNLSYGIAYDGRWKDVGELSFGLSRANYHKTTNCPTVAIDARAKPWLYNATLAVIVSKSIDVYAGYSKGFEESGTPPPSAANRNEPLSSIITEQKDLGVRVKITDDLRAVAGLFDLSRPYFGFAAGNIFEQVGTVRIKGAEFSLSGKVAKDFNLLVGGVLFDPKVTRDADAVGDIGSKPTGLPTHILNINGNWAAPFLKGLQLDFGLVHRGRQAATINNAVFLPPRLNVNAGMRYGFDLAGHKASLRRPGAQPARQSRCDVRRAGRLWRARFAAGHGAVHRRLLKPQRDLAHEAGVVAFGQPLGLGRDRGEHVGQRLDLALGVIAEDVGGDEVLEARPRMADADPHAAEIGAERGVDRAQAVVARRVPPPTRHLDLHRREVELVVEDGQRLLVELVEFERLLNRVAAVVHIGLRLDQQDALAGRCGLR